MANRNRLYKGIGNRHLAAEYGVHYYGSDRMLILVGKTVWKYRVNQALKAGVLTAVFVAGAALGILL